MAKLGLDLTNNKLVGQGADFIAAQGDLVYQISELDLKQKEGSSNIGLVVRCEVIEGRYKGCVTEEYLNIAHSNEDAERISRDTLKTIATVIGHPNPNIINDTDELLNLKPFIGRIVAVKEKVKQQDGSFKFYNKNRIKKFMEFNGEVPAEPTPVNLDNTPPAAPEQQAVPTQQAAPQQPVAQPSNPWG